MKVILSKNPSRFIWTAHAEGKLRHYQLSRSRVLRAFRNPKRVEEGIALNTVAAMQPATPKHTSEIWLMYQVNKKTGQITVITAWRYPAKSPIGKETPVPEEIRRELRFKS